MKNKQLWFNGPYPFLISFLVFLFLGISYLVDGDMIGGVMLLIASTLFFISFLERIKRDK